MRGQARLTLTRDRGAVVAAAGGAVLVAAMFGHWYVIDVSGGRLPGADRLARSAAVNAWQAFAWIDLLLFAAAALAAGRAVFGPATPAMLSPLAVLVAGVAATAAIVYRIVDPPLARGTAFTFTISVGVSPAAYVALAAAVAIVGGALLMHRSSD